MPDWASLDPEGLAIFVRDCVSQFGLSERQARYLEVQLSMRCEVARYLEDTRDRANLDCSRFEFVELGSGLTKQFEFKDNSPPTRFEKLRLRSAKAWRKEHPFKALKRGIDSDLHELMLAVGNLPVGISEWVIREPNSDKPFEGTTWFCREIWKHLYDAQHAEKKGRYELAQAHAFEAGYLAAQLKIRVRHEDYFERQLRITEAQRDSGKGRRKAKPEACRDCVRRYLVSGDKPTEAARNAAAELGVSLTTIRNAFEGSRLPRSSDDF